MASSNSRTTLLATVLVGLCAFAVWFGQRTFAHALAAEQVAEPVTASATPEEPQDFLVAPAEGGWAPASALLEDPNRQSEPDEPPCHEAQPYCPVAPEPIRP